MNIFKEILKNFPDPKSEIIADDPKDQKTADQYSSLLNWKVVESRSEFIPKNEYK